MLGLFWFVFWAGLTVLAIAAGVSLRVRLKEREGPRAPRVDDDTVRQILETGTVEDEHDEPLDLKSIDDEEHRFWSEPWDEPTEW